MSLHNALRFVKLAQKSEQERQRCYETKSREELLQILGFTEVEFEDAINMRLVRCQEQEDAQSLQELRFWFSML